MATKKSLTSTWIIMILVGAILINFFTIYVNLVHPKRNVVNYLSRKE